MSAFGSRWGRKTEGHGLQTLNVGDRNLGLAVTGDKRVFEVGKCYRFNPEGKIGRVYFCIHCGYLVLGGSKADKLLRKWVDNKPLLVHELVQVGFTLPCPNCREIVVHGEGFVTVYMPNPPGANKYGAIPGRFDRTNPWTIPTIWLHEQVEYKEPFA